MASKLSKYTWLVIYPRGPSTCPSSTNARPPPSPRGLSGHRNSHGIRSTIKAIPPRRLSSLTSATTRTSQRPPERSARFVHRSLPYHIPIPIPIPSILATEKNEGRSAPGVSRKRANHVNPRSKASIHESCGSHRRSPALTYYTRKVVIHRTRARGNCCRCEA